jgi:hypothetical protein
MGTEKRKHAREKEGSSIELAVRDKTVPCRVANISPAGAYIEVEGINREHISKEDIGKEVTLNFISSDEPSLRNGIILRFDVSGDAICLAVYFRNI